jgi:hypothetical protein
MLGSILALAACGKEAGRVPFAAEGTATATVTLAQGEVAFWTDIDVEYKGAAEARYQIELVQAGTVVAQAECNPLGAINVKMSWVETNIGDSHSRSGRGKMKCSVEVAKAGPTVVRARLVVPQKPATFELKKADLVLKQ